MMKQRGSMFTSVTIPEELRTGASNLPSDTPTAREPLPTIQTYCQSKTFIAHSGINPLVAAGSGLFSLLNKFSQIDEYKDLDALFDNLIHEIKAFECAAHTQGYHSDQILIARYAICATLDEIIIHSSWGKKSDWKNKSLLYTFQGERWGGESFFLILNRLLGDAKLHVELIEFYYLCISLGFEGKFRHSDKGRREIDNLLDELFQMIRGQRGDYLRKLSGPLKILKNKAKKSHKPIALWKICGITATSLASLYFGFNYLLNMSTNPLMNKLNSVTTTVNYEITR